jgi:hypothetical protein
MPERIQLRRTKGWRKPEGAIVVARPSKWGNPYSVIEGRRDAHEAVMLFGQMVMADDLIGHRWRVAAQAELAGRDLACWCKPSDPCHADVLLELANPSAHPGPDPR